ncbi:MAG: glycosyltransferase family 9 protein [Candidatus Diapherotrites archaeon]|uniref:Glycosyltransferase family 9 protein n=1 Tax=Candidatus Iainarchaeum sp. TaxID=3101447 RepID=A0A7J4JUJ5_9ARCH|nr:MAG: heptosyltransferase III [archaeon GW2011_AR21]MBS3057911.1 glycosyltransferase family 9 protein [Candidatus Diapherotrites archaeon]HIH21453.1 glycosyltransferase family 9 protein [Candidatus Diapherotrites archaeon]HIH33174.1 glycosyltransferase family 9 protein [Candidatus Diapherotrites archaeon]
MSEKELSMQGMPKYYSTKLLRAVARFLAKSFWLEEKKFCKERVKKILFIQLYGIGDYLMSTPAIRAICGEFPKAEKTLYCKPASKEVAELNHFLDKIAAKKPEEHFDLVVSLNDSAEASFITRELNPKYVLGFLKGQRVFANFKTPALKASDENPWIENYLLIAKAIGCRIESKDYVLGVEKSKKVEAILKKERLSKFVILNPNTREGAEAKNWGNANFATLAGFLLKRKIPVVFCGAAGESGSRETTSLVTENGKIMDLTGKLGLKETAFLISKAKAFIGNDTGLMHIALAVKCPTIGIFGPTESRILFPKAKKAFAFQARNKEWPCYSRGTFDVKPRQDFMDTITPEAVFKKARELMK